MCVPVERADERCVVVCTRQRSNRTRAEGGSESAAIVVLAPKILSKSLQEYLDYGKGVLGTARDSTLASITF